MLKDYNFGERKQEIPDGLKNNICQHCGEIIPLGNHQIYGDSIIGNVLNPFGYAAHKQCETNSKLNYPGPDIGIRGETIIPMDETLEVNDNAFYDNLKESITELEKHPIFNLGRRKIIQGIISQLT